MNREPIRVPAFPGPPKPAPPRPPVGRRAPDPRAGTRQLNVRVAVALLDRYAGLVRDLGDEGFTTSTTELVYALLHAGPQPPMTREPPSVAGARPRPDA